MGRRVIVCRNLFSVTDLGSCGRGGTEKGLLCMIGFWGGEIFS